MVSGESLSERQRRYLLFGHALTGFETVSAIAAMGQPLYLIGFVLETLMNTWISSWMYRLVRMWWSGMAFQFFSTSTIHQVLSWYSIFSQKAVAGLIKPETLLPTEDAAAQHSLCAYLQTQDWMLLRSISLDPHDLIWKWLICCKTANYVAWFVYIARPKL